MPRDWIDEAASEIVNGWRQLGHGHMDDVVKRVRQVIVAHSPHNDGPPTSTVDDFDAALEGDERAQLRTVVRSLATQMMVICSFKEVPVTMRVSSKNLARAAVELLGGD